MDKEKNCKDLAEFYRIIAEKTEPCFTSRLAKPNDCKSLYEAYEKASSGCEKSQQPPRKSDKNSRAR